MTERTQEELDAQASEYLADIGLTYDDYMVELMDAAAYDDSHTEALDGCIVEQDGICPHGYPSWLLYAGLI